MYKRLAQILPKEIIKFNEDLQKYSTFGIGGKALAVLEPRNKAELIKCVKGCKRLSLKYLVVGNGSNLLFSTRNLRRVVITTKKMQDKISYYQTRVVVNAGMMISEFILWCKDKGFSGLENLFGIPATVGGMVMMNASAFGCSIYDNLEYVEVFEKGKVKIIDKRQIALEPHKTNLLESAKIILSVCFSFDRLAPSVIASKIKEVACLRQKRQPVGKSAGCVFRNPLGNSAGKIIDELGFKGYKINDSFVSEKHANFIINLESATDTDVKKIIKVIQNKAKKEKGITLEREIEFIGDRDEYYW